MHIQKSQFHSIPSSQGLLTLFFYRSTMDTLIFQRADIRRLLSIDECMNAVERAFRLQGEGKLQPPKILGFPAKDGAFHIKAGLLESGREYFVAKINANFPSNTKKFALPTIQGVI